MSRSTLSMLAVCLTVPLADPPDAGACAAAPVSESGGIGADAQRIFLAVGPQSTEVVVQVTVPETTEDYGILIPVPVQPVLDPTPVDTGELAELDLATRVLVFDNTDTGDGGGLGCGGAKDLANRGGVDVIDRVEIGPLSAVVLTASTASELMRWLGENGFVLRTDSSATVERYVGPGKYFIAARRSDRAVSGAPSSVGLHFTLEGEQLSIPLPIARLGAAEQLAFNVFVAADSAFEPMTGYASLPLDALDRDIIRELGYRSALAAAVSEQDGRAFVIEAVMEREGLLGGNLDAIAGDATIVTRLATVTGPEALTEDLVLTRGPLEPRGRSTIDVTASAEDSGGCSSTRASASPIVWTLLVLGMLRLLRRKR